MSNDDDDEKKKKRKRRRHVDRQGRLLIVPSITRVCVSVYSIKSKLIDFSFPLLRSFCKYPMTQVETMWD